MDRSGRRRPRHQLRRSTDARRRPSCRSTTSASSGSPSCAPPTHGSTRRCSPGDRARRVDPHHERLRRRRGDFDVRGACGTGRARLSRECPPPRVATPTPADARRGPSATCSPSGPSSPARTSRRSCARFDAVAETTSVTSSSSSPEPAAWGAEAFDEACAEAHHRERDPRARLRRRPGVRRDLLAGAAVLAYPSRYEGFGFPPLEAMAAGVPVVAARAGAIPEVVGDAALLVDPDDVDDLASRARHRAHDEEHRDALVARGAIAPRPHSRGPGWPTSSSACTGRPWGESGVTGARGFVGRHLTAYLTAQGTDVVELDVDGARPIDITDHDAIVRRIADEGPDVALPPRGAQPRRRVVAATAICSRVSTSTGRARRARRLRAGGSRASSRRRERGAVRRGRRPTRSPIVEIDPVPPDHAVRREQGRRRSARARRRSLVSTGSR